MGECGCTSGNQVFKLKAPDGWYVVEFMQGCYYCSQGPGLQIYHPESIEPMYFGFDSIEGMEEMPDLPVIGKGGHCITMIKCGLNPDETKEAAIKCFVGSAFDGDSIDEIDAEILGEDFWKDALTSPPSAIYPYKEEEQRAKNEG